MIQSRCALCVVAAVLGFTTLSGGALDAQRNDDKKPSLSLKTSPTAGFSPLKVRATVDVRGGADDAQDFYCPAIEWEWGDDTKSTNSEDCSPYQAGKSQIQRRYSMEHIFNESGSFNVRFRLKQGNRVVANTSAVVHVRPGLRDDIDN